MPVTKTAVEAAIELFKQITTDPLINLVPINHPGDPGAFEPGYIIILKPTPFITCDSIYTVIRNMTFEQAEQFNIQKDKIPARSFIGPVKDKPGLISFGFY